MKSKYHNKRTIVDGISFMSKLEAKRYQQLKLMHEGKAIHDLKLQPRFSLVAGISYVADFSYEIAEKGYRRLIVEDTKGVKTDVFKIKEKLFRHFFPHIDLRILGAKDV